MEEWEDSECKWCDFLKKKGISFEHESPEDFYPEWYEREVECDDVLEDDHDSIYNSNSEYCYSPVRKEKKKKKIDLGDVLEKEVRKCPNKLKKKIFDRDKFCCSCCLKPDELQIHYLDMISENNTERNLITLCKKCHLLIHGEYKEEGFLRRMKEVIYLHRKQSGI